MQMHAISRGIRRLVTKDPPAVEEGSLSYYGSCKWYAAEPGKMLQNYEIIAKLGYGAMSTVWLCHDRKHSCYVVVKVAVAQDWRPLKEMEILDRIRSTSITEHPGAKLIRNYIDTFDVSSKLLNRHTCIVYEPLGPSLKDVRDHHYHGRIPGTKMKRMIKHMLFALDFLHTECDMIHTDIHPGNWLLALEDQQVLEELHDTESILPSIPHVRHGKAVYLSRQVSQRSVSSIPILADLACAVIGKNHDEQATSDVMRPPEIILQLPWSEKIDIWCLGLVIWYCLEGRQWYEYKRAPRKQTELEHMACTIALLGQPDPESLSWIKGSKVWADYFHNDGRFKRPNIVPQASLIERWGAITHDHGEGKQFLRFLLKMLHWRPECRASAGELLNDPWLHDR